MTAVAGSGGTKVQASASTTCTTPCQPLASTFNCACAPTRGMAALRKLNLSAGAALSVTISNRNEQM